MHVYILRHAKADFTRKWEESPVSEEGEKELVRVLDLAKKGFGFKPTLVATSPILRATQTADIVTREMGRTRSVVEECLHPDSKPARVLAYLRTLRKDEEVVLVTHMPIIFDLLHDLIGGKGEVELLNGSLAAVEFKGKAARGKGKLVWLIQPRP